MEQLLTTSVNWLTDNWGVILGLFGGAASLSVFLETLLNKFHIDSKKLAYTAIHLLGLLTAVVTYLLANEPTTDVPAVYAALVIGAQTIHRFMVSPFYNKVLVPFLQYQATQKNLTVNPTLSADPPVDSLD